LENTAIEQVFVAVYRKEAMTALMSYMYSFVDILKIIEENDSKHIYMAYSQDTPRLTF
jgi:hypothetical protein